MFLVPAILRLSDRCVKRTSVKRAIRDQSTTATRVSHHLGNQNALITRVCKSSIRSRELSVYSPRKNSKRFRAISIRRSRRSLAEKFHARGMNPSGVTWMRITLVSSREELENGGIRGYSLYPRNRGRLGERRAMASEKAMRNGINAHRVWRANWRQSMALIN